MSQKDILSKAIIKTMDIIIIILTKIISIQYLWFVKLKGDCIIKTNFWIMMECSLHIYDQMIYYLY